MAIDFGAEAKKLVTHDVTRGFTEQFVRAQLGKAEITLADIAALVQFKDKDAHIDVPRFAAEWTLDFVTSEQDKGKRRGGGKGRPTGSSNFKPTEEEAKLVVSGFHEALVKHSSGDGMKKADLLAHMKSEPKALVEKYGMDKWVKKLVDDGALTEVKGPRGPGGGNRYSVPGAKAREHAEPVKVKKHA